MIQVQLKLRPTKAQERQLEHWLWHLTAVWNWAIRTMANEPRLSGYELKRRLNGHSRRMGIPTSALCGTAATAHRAWREFIKGLVGRPRLKGRRRRLSSIAFDHWEAKLKNNRFVFASLGSVRFHRQHIPEGHIGSARLVHRASGWYLCLFIKANPEPVPILGSGEVGIDPGFGALLALSTGERIEHPHEWRQQEARLGQAQRGGRRQLAARIQERIANRRKNRNHHISRRLVAENALIAFSADRHSAIARRFGKSVQSAGHHQLRSMLAYKCRAGGREYIEVSNRNSTRQCAACGGLTGPAGQQGLRVRTWVCTTCGVEHDRDCNAAVNTLVSGRGLRLESRREAASGTAT